MYYGLNTRLHKIEGSQVCCAVSHVHNWDILPYGFLVYIIIIIFFFAMGVSGYSDRKPHVRCASLNNEVKVLPGVSSPARGSTKCGTFQRYCGIHNSTQTDLVTAAAAVVR